MAESGRIKEANGKPLFIENMFISCALRRRIFCTLREGKNPESPGEKAQKQHVGGQENREGPSGRWAGSPHTPRLPLAPALAAPHWSTSPRSSRAGIVTCFARVGGPPHCTVAI